MTDGAVDDGVADAGDDAAEHRRVDDDLDLDLLAGGLAQRLARAARRCSSSSGTAVRTSATSCCALGRRELDEPVDDRRQVAGPADADHDERAPTPGRGERLAARAAPRRPRSARSAGSVRVGERHAQLVVALEDAGEAEELVLDLAEVALGPRDLEQRLGVRLDRGRWSSAIA